jgi:hypothetical protein
VTPFTSNLKLRTTIEAKINAIDSSSITTTAHCPKGLT